MIIEKKSKKILYQGAKFTVEYAIQNNGSYEAEEFIDSLSIPDRTKIIRIIKYFAETARIFNDEKFKKIEGDIWEFKNYQTRVFMYHCATGCIALTNGVIKKSKKTPETDKERAIRIKEEYTIIRKGLK